MLEKIKEVPFIDESSAVKLSTLNGKLKLERNDRVVWAYETTETVAENINCYVEADKFLTLLPDVKALSQDTCLKVELKNGAKYELPFLDVSWEAIEMPEEYDDSITFHLSDLMLCTLKNLVKPELQCIYIDEQGAVSCDFITACISKTVKAHSPILLPPDVQDLVNGRLCKIKVTEDKIFIQANDFGIVTTKPSMGEDAWWDALRGMLEGSTGFVSAAALSDGLKRLAMFDKMVSFNGEKVVSGSNSEPFAFVDLDNRQYEIERVTKILSTASQITTNGDNLVLKNDSGLFLISPMEEA